MTYKITLISCLHIVLAFTYYLRRSSIVYSLAIIVRIGCPYQTSYVETKREH